MTSVKEEISTLLLLLNYVHASEHFGEHSVREHVCRKFAKHLDRLNNGILTKQKKNLCELVTIRLDVITGYFSRTRRLVTACDNNKSNHIISYSIVFHIYLTVQSTT